MKKNNRDFNIQNFIENAVSTLTNNIKNKENNIHNENNQVNLNKTTSELSNISERLAKWSSDLQKTVNENIARTKEEIDQTLKTEPKSMNFNKKKEQINTQMKNSFSKNVDSDPVPSENSNTELVPSSEKEGTGTYIEKNIKLLSKQKVRVLEEALKTRVFGQDEVISEVVTTLKSAALNIKINKEKPAGCYLFAGPSGVGKTELATAISSKLHVPILKINMGEYSLENDITKLIGTSKGYVGYKEGGLLTNFVKENPACVILFDELEKAHPSIDKPLLSIMDHGICTDNTGQDVSFKETIIIATSNLGAEVEYYGDLTKQQKDEYRMDAIKEGLRPEIINRYDSIFHFNALTPEIYALVSQKFLNSLQKNMQEEHNFNLKFSQKLIDFIVEKSYDPAMGGRPARRFIEQIVIEPLVDRMLDDDFEQVIEEHNEITMDLNKAGNICFKGKKNKILGVQKNTAELVERIEKGKFTQKNQSEGSTSKPKM